LTSGDQCRSNAPRHLDKNDGQAGTNESAARTDDNPNKNMMTAPARAAFDSNDKSALRPVSATSAEAIGAGAWKCRSAWPQPECGNPTEVADALTSRPAAGDEQAPAITTVPATRSHS
jgi:hypothetical protein